MSMKDMFDVMTSFLFQSFGRGREEPHLPSRHGGKVLPSNRLPRDWPRRRHNQEHHKGEGREAAIQVHPHV